MKFFRQCLALLLLLGSSQVIADQQIEAADFNLADYQGKVVYLDFWASWCTPCRASFPFMADIAETLGDDLRIVAVNVDENRDDAMAFLADYETPFDLVFDPEGQLAAQYQVPGMPTAFLFDRDGTPMGSHTGFRKKDMDAIRQWITEAVQN